MLNAAGTSVSIHQCEPDEASEMVGVYQALSGSMTPQFKHLCAQADTIATSFSSGYLPWNTAWLDLTTMLWPSLWYLPPATSFSELQSLQII